MLQIEPGRTTLFPVPSPDKLQQIINRLRKHFEHLSTEDRRKRIIEEVEKMDLTDAERREILRRIL